MRIGTSLVLIALGAILSFAVSDRINDVDLTMIGYILMGVGALGLVITLILSGQNDNTNNQNGNRNGNRNGNPPAV